uniref:PWWP domain-containing protein n=1 Tax=Oryza brachyantha TaxID=4533 RepID=J3M400_ORYBR
MVWGKVKSHPWWPGHVYSITLTSDGEVRRGYRDGLVLVAFFGDSSYGWFEPHELLPFEENFPEKAAQGGGRNFPTAISEAADEVARRAALALLCPCRSPDAFRPHEADPRYLLVDVPGFDTDAEYHPDQVTAEREKIAPRALLDYLKGAALEQRDAADKVWNRNIPAVHMSAMLEAYRRSRFALKDPTYAQAFGMDYEKLQAEKAAALKKARQGIHTHMPNPVSCTVDYGFVSAAMYSNMIVKLTVILMVLYRLNFDSFVLNRGVDLLELVVCFIFLMICMLHKCFFPIGLIRICHAIITLSLPN